MAKTNNDHIFDILRELGDDQLKLFKAKLCDRKLQPRIFKGEVENADRLDLVEKIISRHTTNGAVSVTVNILKSMDCNELATELEEICKGERPGDEDPPAPEKHFIDLHRTDLIERVCNVSAILDRLLDKGVIDQRQYSEIQAENTSQKMMGKILSGPIYAGGDRAKDVLYKILEIQEPFLMEDLK